MFIFMYVIIRKSFPRPPLVKRSTQNAAENDPNKELDEKSGRSRYWFPVKTTVSTPGSPIICTHDLMNWSYQVACGMNYLTKLKVCRPLLVDLISTFVTNFSDSIERFYMAIWRLVMFY